MTDYDTAEFYDCRDSERYEHESPLAAIEEYLDCFASPGCDMVAVIRERSPITVTAYERETVTDDWIWSTARNLAEFLVDGWEEDYGDPDGSGEFDEKDVAMGLEPAIREIIAGATVWRCEKCGERTYSAEEVEAMMREARPDWFEP